MLTNFKKALAEQTEEITNSTRIKKDTSKKRAIVNACKALANNYLRIDGIASRDRILIQSFAHAVSFDLVNDESINAESLDDYVNMMIDNFDRYLLNDNSINEDCNNNDTFFNMFK